MCERFLKFIPSEAAIKFAIKYKNAFVLLMIIAERARRRNGDPDGLTIGQCHLGSHKNYGMTDKEYRYAKKILVEHGLIKIIVTSRTRKKGNQTKKLFEPTNGANGGANELTTTGTLVELCDSRVWDINSEDSNQDKGERKGESGANEGRMKGDKQEREEGKEREESKSIAQPAKKRLRFKDPLSFDLDSMKFTGISEADMADWKKMYTSIDVDVEILKATQHLKENPSKCNKTLWRKFLNGWLKRGNEWAENKKAYKSAGGAQGADRRTKDMDGNPVDNQHKGKF